VARWARPKREAEEKRVGRALERRAGRCRLQAGPTLGRKPQGEKKSFSFSFLIFQSIFQIYFEFPFEFYSNHSIQNFKYSSMNAQTCSYPYI
jgi:hypothetical protein